MIRNSVQLYLGHLQSGLELSSYKESWRLNLLWGL